LPLARGAYSPRDGRVRLARRGRPGRQLSRRERRNLELDVDPIEQRAGQLAQIARRDLRRTAAAAARVAAPSAWTGVHRGDQLAGRREIHLQGGARDRDAAGFEWLAQRFEDRAIEFGHLAFLHVQLSILA
jgi:hypothetical protein